MCKWLQLCFLVFLSLAGRAQFSNSYRSKTIITAQGAMGLDTLSIVPSSVKVRFAISNELVDSNLYSIDYAKAKFTWKNQTTATLKIDYRVFPILFSKTYFNKDARVLERQVIDNRKFYTYTPPAMDNTLLNLEGLNKSGSISRGIMFGNNQNLSVNSNMVLQMAGKIGNNIDILAAISDDNLPIQPEGNTQQLNDFDRVFIQLKRDSTQLIAGDFELKRPDSYFMNF